MSWKVCRIHHLETTYVCTNLCANPSRGCWRLCRKSEKCHLPWICRGSGVNFRKSPKSGIIFLGPWISLRCFMAINPVNVEMFQSGAKCWIDRLTNTAIHRVMTKNMWQDGSMGDVFQLEICPLSVSMCPVHGHIPAHPGKEAVHTFRHVGSLTSLTHRQCNHTYSFQFIWLVFRLWEVTGALRGNLFRHWANMRTPGWWINPGSPCCEATPLTTSALGPTSIENLLQSFSHGRLQAYFRGAEATLKLCRHVLNKETQEYWQI